MSCTKFWPATVTPNAKKDATVPITDTLALCCTELR